MDKTADYARGRRAALADLQGERTEGELDNESSHFWQGLGDYMHEHAPDPALSGANDAGDLQL